MVETSAGEPEASRDVCELEVRQFLDDLLGGKSGGEQVEDVNDTDPHPTYAGASPALVGVHGDAVHQLDGLSHGVLAKEGLP